MKLRAFTIPSVAIAVTLAGGSAYAALITGVTVSSDMGAFLSELDNMIDGSGLTGELATGIHAASTEGIDANAWKSTPGITAGNVTFDLGGLFVLDAFYVWNNSQNTDGSRGVNGVNVLISIDGTNYVALPGGPSSFAQQAASPAIPAQEFLVSNEEATHVRFAILGNHNPTGFSNVGLSEVQFSGSAVPEPTASIVWGLLGLAFACGCWWQRRRRAA